MPQPNLLSPNDAVNEGDLIYELILPNWGNWGTKRDAQHGSVQYPPVAGVEIPLVQDPGLPSVFGLMIAPRSDVDRCIIRYNVHRKLAAPAGSSAFFFNSGGELECETKVAVEAPYIGQLTGPIIVRADPAHWFADSYLPANVAAPSPLPAFGTALAPPAFIDPSLRLLLYLSSKIGLPPRGRAPFYTSFVRSFTAGETATEVLLRVAPIMGRRRVRVSFAASGAGNVDVRVTGTFTNVTPSGGGVPNVAVQEIPLAGPVTVSAASGGAATLTVEDPESSFLMLKATPSAAGVSLRAAISARD